MLNMCGNLARFQEFIPCTSVRFEKKTETQIHEYAVDLLMQRHYSNPAAMGEAAECRN